MHPRRILPLVRSTTTHRTVLVAGFGGAVGSGIREVIAADPELDVVGELEWSDVRRRITDHRPDALLVDLGVLESVMDLRRLVVAYPDLGVVIGIMRVSRRRDTALLAAGARMVIPMTVDPAELRGALKLVARGLVGPPRVARSPITSELDRLTEREGQVFELLLRRRSGREIATTLQISTATVHTHTRRIYEKLGVHSRAELAAHAAELGLSVGRPGEPGRLPSSDRIPFERRACGSMRAARPSSADLRAALGVGRWSAAG